MAVTTVCFALPCEETSKLVEMWIKFSRRPLMDDLHFMVLCPKIHLFLREKKSGLHHVVHTNIRTPSLVTRLSLNACSSRRLSQPRSGREGPRSAKIGYVSTLKLASSRYAARQTVDISSRAPCSADSTNIRHRRYKGSDLV